MENAKIFLENGQETNVNAFFYIYNSKYYFMYTTGELDGPEYIKIYVAQVCKEVKNTPTGPVDTGYMLGMEISDPEEWTKVQQSITKIVSDKKGETQSSDIQYLPMNMLTNLKIVGKNKFKLMKNIVEDNFKVILSQNEVSSNPQSAEIQPTVEPVQPLTPSTIENVTTEPVPVAIEEPVQSVEIQPTVEPVQPLTPSTIENVPTEPVQPLSSIVENSDINQGSVIEEQNDDNDDVIVDYRAKFFEEQDKNQQLEEQIKELNEKLENIKSIIG